MYDRHIVLDLEFAPVPKRLRKLLGMSNEIIQIGAVMLDSAYRKIGTFSTLVKPEYITSLHPEITKLTGIREQDLEEAPLLSEALEKFFAWVGQGRIRFYSWSDSDQIQFQAECMVKGFRFPFYRWSDFQKIYGRLFLTLEMTLSGLLRATPSTKVLSCGISASSQPNRIIKGRIQS